MGMSSTMPNVAIEGIQTIVPTDVTNPKISSKLSNLDAFDHHTFNKYMHTLLCYEKLGGEESGWFHCGWFKDTLGKALSEHPMLGGRLQRHADGFEIVSNDAGVRVIEATSLISLEEFVVLFKGSGREEAISQLLHMKEVDEENLHFSPLIHLQITNFKCGGYSLGISYNLLLADPFLMEGFLKRWAEIHKHAIFAFDNPKIPLFYLPDIKRMGNLPPTLVSLKPSKDISSTSVVMFEVADIGGTGLDACNSIALRCVEEAESKAGAKMTPNFALLVKEASGDTRVDFTSKANLVSGLDESSSSSKYAMKRVDDFGARGVAIWKGNNPALVHRCVGSLGRDGLVLVVISAGEEGKIGMKVTVTFPN